jgi:GH35 family endo-1,4-beta-xylanase
MRLPVYLAVLGTVESLQGFCAVDTAQKPCNFVTRDNEMKGELVCENRDHHNFDS